MTKRNGGGGGGPSMNKNVSVGLRTGKPTKGVSPQAASRIGMQVVTSTGVATVPNPKSVPLGNQTTESVGLAPVPGALCIDPARNRAHPIQHPWCHPAAGLGRREAANARE